MAYIENPPYSLFQGPDGYWGTKDKDGNVQIPPVFKRSKAPGHEFTFISKDELTIVEFDSESGFYLVAWCSGPWYDDAWGLAFYPIEFESILWENINSHRKFASEDCYVLEEIEKKQPLTLEQIKLFRLLKLLFQYEDEKNESIEDELEIELLNEETVKWTAEERLQTIIPIIKNPAMTPDEKSTLYYGLFILNYRLTYLK